MKAIVITSLIAFFFTGILRCQTHSNITFDAGTNIIVQTGTDICADTIIFNGTYTINGTICGHSIGINPIASEIPNSYYLYQNFPNPFNPVTKIKFDLPKSNLTLSGAMGLPVKLIICDILGREVTTLVNEQLKPGTYEVEFDGSNYPSGVYFYKLTAGSYTDTKKLVLIK
jgi:hypothetical protein